MTRQPAQEAIEHLQKRGFRIEKWVGGGAYGNVYKAIQARLRRPVAVKLFDNPHSRGEKNRKRFEREAPLLALVEHPSIPYVITTGAVPHREKPDVPYTVMQFIDGVSLEERMRSRAPLDHSEIRRVMGHVLGALSVAHKLDVVHRDVKPDNVMLSEYGVYLIDFSIGITLLSRKGLTRATASGERVGTYDYAAPEQKTNSASVTHKVDIYSAGVVLAELLGAKVPIRLSTLDVELSKVAKPIIEIIRRAAAENPDDRYSTAQDFLVDLDQELRPVRSTDCAEDVDISRLTDDDVALLAIVTIACQMPGSHTTQDHVMREAQGIMLPELGVAISLRRLIRLNLIEIVDISDRYEGGYSGIRCTGKGDDWIETHQKRAAVLLSRGGSVPKSEDLGPSDDIPF